jgi:hypothetical protein
MLIGAAEASKQALPCFAVAHAQVVVQRLACDLRQLEAYPAGLTLAHVGAVDGVAIGCHVIDAKRYEIAAAQLAVDRQIEQRQVARTTFQLKLGSDQPHVPWAKGRFCAGELAFVPGRPIGPRM